MKKKLVLIVAVVLIAITACACLAGCVPNRPDKFVGTWATSTHKGMSYTLFDTETRMGIDGSKMEIKVGDSLHVIFEEKGSEFNVYTYNKLTGWIAVSIPTAEAEKNDNFKKIKDALNSEEVIEAQKKAMEAFEENFEKKDGWWTAKADVADAIAYKVEGNELLTKIGGEETGSKLILNYKISIPAEAKAALK